MEHQNAVAEVAKEIVGMTVDSAREYLQDRGWSLRIVCVDGKGCICTHDFLRDRINVKVEAGIVTEYEGNG